MNKAWPRFLPEPSPDVIAHALIIEAYAIVAEQLADAHASLTEAHERALSYAGFHYGPDDIRSARDACAAADENQTPRLPLLLGLSRSDEEPLRSAA